ncbi:xylanase [Coprinopsis sp. MPI-PUGE-AT-0042]|nr:xylanase [Coprinopsis sp. MPI-PUGE-AT-0042]
MKFSSLIIPSTALVGSLANPVLNARAGTPNSSGVHNGFFYSWTSETGNNATYTNEDAGTYSVQWSTMAGKLSGGKGWSPGKRGKVINYNGTYQVNGNSDLGVYGWTRKPLVEYYIIESFGYLNPAAGALRVGNTTCLNDGVSTRYEIYQITRSNQPSIDGTQTFKQFWSCHFGAWKDLGLEIGEELVYQLFATEGWYSSGKASITVS